MGPTIIGMPQREQTWFVKNKIEKPTYWENIQGESRPIWGNGAYDKKNQKLLSRYKELINAEENNRLNKNNSIKVVNPFPDNKGRPGTANTVSQSPHSSYPEELSEKITELEKLLCNKGTGKKRKKKKKKKGGKRTRRKSRRRTRRKRNKKKRTKKKSRRR